MGKLWSYLLLFFVLAWAVSATTAHSFRGSGGIVEYLGCDEGLVSPKVNFAYTLRARFGELGGMSDGSGGLVIQARTEYGNLVVLNIRMTPYMVLGLGNGIIRTQNYAHGSYWIQGSRPIPITFNPLYVEIDNGKTNIYAGSEPPCTPNSLGFKVSQINTITLR